MKPEELEVTPEERETHLSAVFSSRSPLVMKQYPTKYKRRLVALERIAEEFEPGRMYTQREVNAILEAIWWDPVLLRRDLIGIGLLDRKKDGSQYWRAAPKTETE